MIARIAFALTVAVVGGAVAFDRVEPAAPAPRAARVAAAQGGIAACPVAVLGRGKAYLHLANVGTAASSVRVTLVPRRGKRVTLRKALGRSTVATLRLHGRVRAPAAAIVEHAGGRVIASHSIWISARGGARGGAAAMCGRAGPGEVVVAHARTYRAESRLVLVNPGSADADVSVTLLADGRTLQPERLSRRVVPARGRREFRLGDFAFDAEDLTALVRSTAGRVIAEVFVERRTGVSIVSGQASAGAVVVTAGGSGKGSAVGVVAAGEDDTGVESRLIRVDDQRKAPGVPDALAPGEGRRAPIPERGPAAYAFDVAVGSPVAAGATWETSARGVGDRAATESAVPARRWAVVFGNPGGPLRARLLIANAGAARARLRIRRIDGDGVSSSAEAVDGGRLLSLGFGDDERRAGTFAFEIVADRPVVVGMSARARGKHVYGFGLTASRIDAGPLVAPLPDPRAGIPARIAYS